MTKYEDSHQFFDFFIIPTVSKPKQLKDTISTIEMLNEIGVDSEKIIPVFNMVEDTEVVEKSFSAIFNYHKQSKAFNLKNGAVIRENELFANLKNSTMSIDDLVNDETDYKELMRATSDKNEKVRLMNIMANKMLANGLKKQLDSVFQAII
jgi:orotate phosphoribosyltransferase-like protein